jgi:hypothetical protein
MMFGADKPIQGPHGGSITAALLQTDSSASVTVPGDGGRLVKIDTALLEATAPLLNLASGSTVTVGGHAIDLVQNARLSTLVPADALVKLNASTLNVLKGHLVNVAGGSRLTVLGDFLTLSNGSTLNILNGALLNVSGGSAVDIAGSLVRFTGTGNLLNVNNSVIPTAIIGGIPVAGPASSFKITNPALAGLGTSGTIKVNGVSLTPTTPLGSLSGSLVVIQGSGTVRVGQ